MKVSLAKGTQDFLPNAAVPRQKVMAQLAQVFEKYGFEPLETPAFEKIETLTGKYGDEGEKLIFKILKRGEDGKAGEADLALRYDLTVPLARVVAMYGDLPRPFKRYQLAPVWRAERPQRGRFREFYQCDVDVAGSTSSLVETELLAMAVETYTALGFTDFTVWLNHRQVLRGLIHGAGIPESREIEALVTLDKLDKIGREGVSKELLERGFTAEQLQPLQTLMGLSGDNETLLEQLSRLVGGHAEALAGIAKLREILGGLEQAGVSGGRVRISPVLARGLSYYTGAIYEVQVEGFSSSIGAGGRYDNLVGLFSSRTVPACGFSFGLDRILMLMQERKLLGQELCRTQVLVPLASEAVRGDCLRLAAELRAAGVRVDVYPELNKLGTQLQYGTQRGIPWAVIQTEAEKERGGVNVRNLKTREQTFVARDAAVAHMLQLLNAP